ncbi:MAG: tRNA lysidine(34) synthetase TilS [Propionibacteriaceae bacterium]|nr:tRNA lysidine(34) synthetase TilS [Propionibacteriaceae bacterium]
MARRELSPAQLAVVQAVRAALPDAVHVHHVRVACSGGADSLALAAGLAWLDAHEPDPLRRSSGLVVDHGLQDGSTQVAAGVVEVLRGLGLPSASVRVDVQAGADGLEAAARDARYAALAGALTPTGDGANLVLVGHTMDDQAETVLLGLARGSGTRSLAGMPAMWQAGSVTFVRPLLALRRATTRQACVDWGLAPWDDPMNDDDRFARVRARRLLPLIEQALGPGVVEALARTAGLARVDADFLDEQAERSLGQEDGLPVQDGLPVPLVMASPAALRGRIVRAWLARQGITELSFERTQAVLALVDDWHGQAHVDLPGGRRVVRRDDVLWLS